MRVFSNRKKHIAVISMIAILVLVGIVVTNLLFRREHTTDVGNPMLEVDRIENQLNEMDSSDEIDQSIRNDETEKQGHSEEEDRTPLETEFELEGEEELTQNTEEFEQDDEQFEQDNIFDANKELLVDEITYGIDVAKWQGIIDWKKVKEAGVQFVMIRVGNRTQVDGVIQEDAYAKYNLQQAQKHGIQIGVYFFSTAVNKQEAKEEAEWVTKYIAPYRITYPVVYNCEGFTEVNSRQNGLTKEKRTDLAVTFLDYIKKEGYTPMFYAAKHELDNNYQWETDRLEQKYKIWVAQYPAEPYPDTPTSSYQGNHHMWQFTSTGNVPGVPNPVDINVAYFAYKKSAEPKDMTPQETVNPDPAALIRFKEVDEVVTAKHETNLRREPSSTNEKTIVTLLKYGETAKRTGIGDNGWSRIEYKGRTLYAVSSYLTTDLNFQENNKPTVEKPENGIEFTNVNETVTAKEKTNLRSVPSAESNDTIVEVLYHGDLVLRTGVGSNGWSRIEYNDRILYAVTSYLEIVTGEE